MAREIQAQDVIVLIVYLVLLLVGAYYLTKFIGKRALQKGVKRPAGKKSASGRARWKQGQYVSVVDRIAIDRDKTLVVIEFNNKRYLMATTSQEVKLLDKTEISPEEAAAEDAAAAEEGTASGEYADEQIHETNFFLRFWKSFKQVAGNYFTNRKGMSFGSQLKNEMEKAVEETKNEEPKTDNSTRTDDEKKD